MTILDIHISNDTVDMWISDENKFRFLLLLVDVLSFVLMYIPQIHIILD